MIKKNLLLAIFIFVSACSINAQITDSSINPADRYIWNPTDEDDLESRRLQQTRFDGITKEIETLFLNFEAIPSKEKYIRSGTKGFMSKIDSMETDRNNQIINERIRIDNLNKKLREVRSSNKKINNKMVNMYLAPIFTTDEYISAFYYYRRGQYLKSGKLFNNLLDLNPPEKLIDNILFGLSMSYYKSQKFSKAKKTLSQIIKNYPHSEKWYMSHVMLALTHERKNEKSQSLYVLEKALKNDPPYFIRSVINNLIDLVQEDFISISN